MSINFNPLVNIDAVATEYKADKRARIFSALDDMTAQQLSQYIQDEVTFEAAFVLEGQPKTASFDFLKAQAPKDMQKLMQEIYLQASQGVGFLYGRHLVDPKSKQDNLVQQAFNFLNAPTTIDAIKKISGFDDIKAASAQVTRYLPNNFLTRHNDINPNEKRRVAYVLNLSPQWHPDWGGLLQFYQKDGVPRDAWAPVFNSLSLFDAEHVHAVTSVAPFAVNPRLAITGWFRARPL